MNVRWSFACLGLLACAPTAGGDAGTDAGPVGQRCYELTSVLPNCASGPDRYSDEACQALDDMERRTGATMDAVRAAVITSPANGARVPSATPPTFTWTGGLAWRRPTTLDPMMAARAFSWRDELVRWQHLVPRAEAHCAPFNGIGYALDFRVVATGATILRVEQSTTQYTPDAATWARLRVAGSTFRVTLTTARFRESTTVSEGPFVPVAPYTFSVEGP